MAKFKASTGRSHLADDKSYGELGRTAAGITVKFGGLVVTGPAAQWLLDLSKEIDGELQPTAIQKMAMLPIFEGQSVALQAPTGSGKTLAYLLPALMRLKVISEGVPGLRMLIVVPSSLLQWQTAAVARMLVGKDKANGVWIMRRDVEYMKAVPIVIATPLQIMELYQDEVKGRVWREQLADMDILCLDEVDTLLDHGGRKLKEIREKMGKPPSTGVLVLDLIRKVKAAKNKALPQVIGLTATMNRRTERKLRFNSGVECMLIRAAGADIPLSPMLEQSEEFEGQYGDMTSCLPEGLVQTVRGLARFNFPDVMKAAANTILDLNADRTLVVIMDSPEVAKGSYPLLSVASWLRFRVESQGYRVQTTNKVVEESCSLWVEGARGVLPEEREQREILVGTAQNVRGLHFNDVDAVVLIGLPHDIPSYLHTIGRCCRHQPNRAKPVGGRSVLLSGDDKAHKVVLWGDLLGFSCLDVPLSRRHPSLRGDRVDEVNEARIEQGLEPLPDPSKRSKQWDVLDADNIDDLVIAANDVGDLMSQSAEASREPKEWKQPQTDQNQPLQSDQDHAEWDGDRDALWDACGTEDDGDAGADWQAAKGTSAEQAQLPVEVDFAADIGDSVPSAWD